MAILRCAWCGKTLGLGPGPADMESHGICDACEARFDAEAALAHAIVGLEAITDELRRAAAGIWPPGIGPRKGAP